MRCRVCVRSGCVDLSTGWERLLYPAYVDSPKDLREQFESMNASGVHQETVMHEWRVFVSSVGYIGTVHEKSEELARCAALSKFGEEGRRPLTGAIPLPHIYENDAFDVFQL